MAKDYSKLDKDTLFRIESVPLHALCARFGQSGRAKIFRLNTGSGEAASFIGKSVVILKKL